MLTASTTSLDLRPRRAHTTHTSLQLLCNIYVTCIYICIYVCTHTHTHTHTNTYVAWRVMDPVLLHSPPSLSSPPSPPSLLPSSSLSSPVLPSLSLPPECFFLCMSLGLCRCPCQCLYACVSIYVSVSKRVSLYFVVPVSVSKRVSLSPITAAHYQKYSFSVCTRALLTLLLHVLWH